MKDFVDEGLNRAFGSRNVNSNYTLDEIKKAEKRKKQYGGTLLDNLREVTGRTLPSQSDFAALYENAESDFSLAKGSVSSKAGADSMADIADGFARMEELSRELTEELSKDYGNKPAGTATGMKSSATAGTAECVQDKNGTAKEKTSSDKEVQIDFESFNGIAEKVAEDIYGQEAFLKKLVIAFKRPYAIGAKEGMPANSFYVGGADNTGRHSAIQNTVAELALRNILPSDKIVTIDLSMYPEAESEKLFLQDLYSAVCGPARVIVFENYTGCHPTYITMLGDLVGKGAIPLSTRYMKQNGQLIGVTNALAGESVGTLRADGHYLIFLGADSVTKLTDVFGAPFVNSLGDICLTAKLDESTYSKVAERELEELKAKAEKQLKFKLAEQPAEKAEDTQAAESQAAEAAEAQPAETSDETSAAEVQPAGRAGIVEFSLTRATKDKGLAGIIDFYDDLYKALAQLRLENSFAKKAEVILTADVDAGCVTAKIGKETFTVMGESSGDMTGATAAVKAELDEIIGLSKVKEYVLSLEEYYKIQQRRRAEGLKAGEVNKHMIFTGNPGTGKTTIARIISRYLKAMGVLSGGQLVEVTRADLVGRYVGHTAPLTNQVIKSALGGVLFIDEAYSLYRGKDDAFGLEAIDTLVKGIEDNRDDLIVILAGYSKEMETFLESNSGLKSRFPNLMDFPDYTGEELTLIAKSIAKSKGYFFDEEAEKLLLDDFTKVQATRARDAGNGRYARNRVEEAILNQSRRLIAEPDSDLSLLTAKDM